MAVYPPSGSGGAHMDQAISGKKATQPKMNPAKAAKAAKAVPKGVKASPKGVKAAPKKEKK